MDTEELIREFKAEYKKKGHRDLLYQVSYLSELADKYQEKDDWPSLLRAHSLYNSCAVRDAANKERWLKRAYLVQQDYCKTYLQSYSQHQLVIQTLKHQLEEIRDRRRRQTERIADLFQHLHCEPDRLLSSKNQELYIQILTEIPNLSTSVNRDMIAFTRLVVEKALDICGPPMCNYCVVALGSLARGEGTPYSDLEFLFLVESSKMTESIVKHFERFAVVIYFLIGSLGETKLKYMAIPELQSEQWFIDSAMNGFKIDGLGEKAGNIPTGNGSVEQQNHFICSVQELAEKYKLVSENPDPDKSLTGDLTAMLSSTVYISGDQRLHSNFSTLIAFHQPNEQRQLATVKMLKRDASNFDFRPGSDLTHIRHLKTDIYRYPSLLILNLKILHSIQSSDPWEIIWLLERQAVITSQTAHCLKFSLCCAQIIRLSAYFYHNSQNEEVSVLSCKDDDNLYKGAWYLRPELLAHMFIHLLPLKEAVSEICNSGVLSMIATSMSDTARYKAVALTRYYCGDDEKVLFLLNSAHPDGLESADPFTQRMYIHAAIMCKQYLAAERLLIDRNQSQCFVAYDFYLLGLLYEDQCDFPQALEAFKMYLAILISLHGPTDHRAIAEANSSMGVVLCSLKKYGEALVYYRKSLDMYKRISEGTSRDDVAIADLETNLGVVLHKEGNYAKALVKYRRVVEMYEKIYGDKDHVDIADILFKVGVVLHDMNACRDALIELRKSLDMYIRIYGDAGHPDIVGVRKEIRKAKTTRHQRYRLIPCLIILAAAIVAGSVALFLWKTSHNF